MRRSGLFAAFFLLAGISDAANIDKALAYAESRRKAAENGLRDITQKAADTDDAVRTAYAVVASQNNGWLERALT